MKYKINHPRRNLRGWFWFIGGGLVILAILLLGWLLLVGNLGVTIASQSSIQTVDQPKPDVLTSRLLVVGDVFWGRSVQRKAEASGKGPAYLMSGIDPADRANYDAWIGNFECPVTNSDIPYSQQITQLKFNCRPEYLSELAKWFTAVSLANNHTDNNGGSKGLAQTRANLESAGIQYAGTYDMSQTADICEVISLPAKVKNTKTIRNIPVALCGYHYVVNVPPSEAQLMIMEQYSRYMPVIAMPHMGVEYRTTAEPAKVATYRRMIDSGASVVVAAHPHVIQNSEVYRGKLIVYSLGNFLFDQQSLGRDTSVGLGLELDIEVADDTAYKKMSTSCVPHKDSCLSQLQTSKPQRSTIKVSYGFRCFDMATGVPVAGGAAVCDQASQRASSSVLQSVNKQL